MKKIILSLLVITSAATAAYAQPTLTAATSNPIAGDVFYGFQVDPTVITPGAAGPAVTWNYPTLPVSGLDTTAWVTCISTPYCDSFLTSNIANKNAAGDYSYANAGTSTLSMLGQYSVGIYMHITGNWDLMYYPFTYLSTHKNIASIHMMSSGIDFFMYVNDSMDYDGYGTLKLKSATYTNVVRQHIIRMQKDSTGSPFNTVTISRIEIYNWFIAGFHNPLFTYTIDTANGNNAKYYLLTGSSPLVTSSVAPNATMEIYPNPAAGVIHIRFNTPDINTTSVTITDMVGRTAGTVNKNEMNPGLNDIKFPVYGLPAGMYIVHLQTGTENSTQKIVVTK